MKQLIFVLLTVTLLGCNRNEQNAGSDSKYLVIMPFELVVRSHDYARGYGIHYTLTESSICVVLIDGSANGSDTVMWDEKLRPSRALERIALLNLDTLKDHYLNPCIEDGSQIVVVRNGGDSTSKSVHVSNYYQEDVGSIISYINGVVPSRYAIWYDKNVLLMNFSECLDTSTNY